MLKLANLNAPSGTGSDGGTATLDIGAVVSILLFPFIDILSILFLRQCFLLHIDRFVFESRDKVPESTTGYNQMKAIRNAHQTGIFLEQIAYDSEVDSRYVVSVKGLPHIERNTNETMISLATIRGRDEQMRSE
jgi:hypothetical protein